MEKKIETSPTTTNFPDYTLPNHTWRWTDAEKEIDGQNRKMIRASCRRLEVLSAGDSNELSDEGKVAFRDDVQMQLRIFILCQPAVSTLLAEEAPKRRRTLSSPEAAAFINSLVAIQVEE